AFKPGHLSFAPRLSNPLGIEGAAGVYTSLNNLLLPLPLILFGACLASVMVRFRRASGDERQQLKWFAYASVLVIVVVAATPLEGLLAGPEQQAAYEVLFRIAVAALPIAAGIAIL